MHTSQSVVELHRVDHVLLARLARIEKACLAASTLLGAAALATQLAPIRSIPIAWIGMSANAAVATLACTLSLALSFQTESPATRIVGRLLATTVVLAGLAELVNAGASSRVAHVPVTPTYPAEFPGVIAGAFVLLGLAVLVLRWNKGPARHLPDILLGILGLVVLTLVSESLFRAMPVFGIASDTAISTAAVCALALLTFVTFGRRMECGLFSIILGPGHGSRFARGLLPLLIVLPILREMGRARIVAQHLLPRHYASATLASIAAMVSIVLLLAIAYYFRRLEGEIQHLTLHDELTGVYNLRGIRVLADQALRLAQRSQLPFSILYVDLDDLKQVNDELGHGAGSKLLIQTADLLRSSFRETDVVGRIGGDEFVVAGQFSREAIAMAAERLAEQSARTADRRTDSAPLRLSIGYVTTNPGEHESLQDMLDRADAAMYEDKRGKKLQAI